MARIMVIAGGEWQTPLAEYIKNKGHFVINTNLFENSPAFAYADKTYVVNVLDKQKNLEIARKHDIQAVVSDQSDISVPTVAFIAEELGLCGIGTKSAELFTNKYLMRERLKELGYEMPDYELCKTSEDAKRFLNRHGIAVIKPPDNQSSRGVHIIRKGQDIDAEFQDAISASPSENALIEEYLEGIELTVEGYKTKYGHTTLAISEKQKMKEHPQIAQTVWYSVSSLDKHAQLVKTHNSLIEDMGLPFGITHTEYKYHNGKYSLIEAAARGGGTKISSHIIPCFSGVDVYQNLLADILGEGDSRINAPKPACSVVLDFFIFKPGKIKSITGIELILSHPNVIDIGLNFNEGDNVPLLADDRSRAGYIIAHARNDEELSSLLPNLKEKVCVTYE